MHKIGKSWVCGLVVKCVGGGGAWGKVRLFLQVNREITLLLLFVLFCNTQTYRNNRTWKTLYIVYSNILYSILYYTVLYHTVHYTVLYHTVLYCTLNTVLYHTVLYIVLYTVLYCTLPYCTLYMYFTILYSTVLQTCYLNKMPIIR